MIPRNPTTYTQGQSGQENPLYSDNYNPNMQSGGNNFGGALTIAGQVGGAAMDMYSGISNIDQIDINQRMPNQVYNPRVAPPTYMAPQMPEEIMEGTGFRTGLQNVGRGAQAGMAVAGPLGAAVGAGVGAITGAIAGGKAKAKRRQFEKRKEMQKRQYGEALNRYFDIQNQQRQQLARQSLYGQRGQNVNAIHQGAMYGLNSY